MFCLCFACFFFNVCQNPKILFSQNKILDFCLTQVLRKQNVCQTYVKHVGDISFTLAAGLYQVWISNWQLLDTGGTANSCFTYVANFTHMFCFMCHLCFNYIPFMCRLRSTYVLSYVWHMFHIRFTYVSFMFHICFYLRLDIVYVYVMPRPPSIETIPGAPLDQPKFCLLLHSCILLPAFSDFCCQSKIIQVPFLHSLPGSSESAWHGPAQKHLTRHFPRHFPDRCSFKCIETSKAQWQGKGDVGRVDCRILRVWTRCQTWNSHKTSQNTPWKGRSRNGMR